ncbi:MAG: 3-methyl-2-oxobutanoate dehydrogenase subunit VorB [bacterium]
MTKRILMKGNIALCEGAIKAGCQAYFGYPITPQNEIPAWMSKRMVELGRVFIQSESEVSAINMVFGAALTGARAMTSSSSPGISLKQEGISYMAGCELPGVIVNVQRGGPGLGNIAGSQADYFQSTRGGGHGDYRTLVLAPGSVQEMYDLVQEAFDLADKYRNPVLVLTDGILGQMMEPIQVDEDKSSADKQKLPPKDWILDGAKGRPPRSIKSLLMTEGFLEEHNRDLEKKYQKMKEEARYEAHNLEGAEIVLVAFGIAARVAKSAMQLGNKKGIKVGLIRPITLYPFPEEIISQTADKVKKFLVVELNLGQMVEDVKLAAGGKAEVHFYGRPGGGIISQEEVLEEIMKIKGKE